MPSRWYTYVMQEQQERDGKAYNRRVEQANKATERNNKRVQERGAKKRAELNAKAIESRTKAEEVVLRAASLFSE